MIGVWYCLRDRHDERLVALAFLICSLACIAAVTLLRQQRGADARIDQRWRLAAGVSTGFGIWSTHFIAMLGFTSGVPLGYAITPTLLSLAIAIGMTCFGFALASSRKASAELLAGGGIAVGAGIVAMHYTGMLAVELPARFIWSPDLIAVSFVLAIGFAAPALFLALRRKGLASGSAAVAMMMLAILTLHFTGMAAVQVIPDASFVSTGLRLSPVTLAIIIGAVALAVLIIGAAAAWINAVAVSMIDARGREYRILVQGITDCALYMLDGDGTVVSWNAGAERLKGFTSEEAIGLNFRLFHSDDDRAAGVPDRALAQARAYGSFKAEGWRYRKDRSRFWAHVTIETVVDDQGAVLGFAKITRDMTRQKEDQDELLALTTKLDAALTNMHQGLVLFDADERVMLVNARFLTMYRIGAEVPLEGLTFPELLRTCLLARTCKPIPDDRIVKGRAWMDACLAMPDGGTVTIDFEDGSYIDVSYRALPDGGVVATFEDVTERHRSEARITHLALHDGLTGLPNRVNFNECLDAALEQARATGTRVGVVAIDFDGFKEINDAHGHAVGDMVLQGLATRLTAVIGQGEIVARIGGDEFAAFCRFFEESALQDFTERLLGVFAEPIEADLLEIKIGGSLGLAVFPEDGVDREPILNNADLAMYRAKTAHGVHLCRYEFGMDETARTRRAMAKDLREAVTRDEFRLAFQVQKSVQTGAVTGYEALLRWEHPLQGWISPEDFVPVAEESGSIVEIGRWVLRQACREAARWPKPWRVAVNLSPIQFNDRDLPTVLAEILLETGLPPKRLELEITESAIIADRAAALHMLRQIKALGVTIAIDDFGTGYSSLETLNAFPFDKIKIDRSFVLRSDRSDQARAIIRAVLALGGSLRMPVLAEGVETEGQLEFLRGEGCGEVQGYLFGRPSFDVAEGDEEIAVALGL